MYRKSHTHTRMPHTKNNIILVPVLMLLFLFVPISWCVCMFYLIFMNILLYSSPPVLFFVYGGGNTKCGNRSANIECIWIIMVNAVNANKYPHVFFDF